MDNVKLAILYLKIALYSPKALLYYKDVLRFQYLSQDEQFHINWKKRKKVLQHAYLTVPYYREKFNSIGLSFDDIVNITPQEFGKLPLLTREDIQNNFANLISEKANKKRLVLVTTGGSSGNPIKLYHDKRFYGEVLVWRMLCWWGLRPSVDQAILWRLVRRSKKSQWINSLTWWPTRRIYLDASSIDTDTSDAFLLKLKRYKPKLIKGYVGAIDALSRYVLENHLDVPSPEAVWVTAAPISDVQKKNIEAAFHAPVYDQYACSEIYWVAAQCRRRDGLHIFSDARYVEFINYETGLKCSEGEYGDIVITDLENYVFPLIRYRNGDRGRARLGCCGCGIELPLMDKVKGRVSDNVVFPDGTVISGEYLTTIFDDFPDAVKAFQIQQKIDYSLNLFIVVKPEFRDGEFVFNKVRETLSEKSNGQVPIRIIRVDDIKSDRGKIRFVKSEITD